MTTNTSQSLLFDLLDQEGVKIPDSTVYDPSESPNITASEIDGNVNGHTLITSNTKPVTEVVTSRSAGSTLSAQADELFESVMSGVDKILQVQGIESDVIEAARAKSVEILSLTDFLRSNLEMLNDFRDMTIDARNQMVTTPDLLRQEPYMNELWYHVQREGIDEDDKHITSLDVAEGVIATVHTNKGDGDFSIIKDTTLPLPVVDQYNGVFRNVQSEYESVFKGIAQGIKHIPDLDLVKQGATPISSGRAFTSDRFDKWGLKESDFENSSSPFVQAMYSRAKIDTGSGLDQSFKEMISSEIEHAENLKKKSKDAKTTTSQAGTPQGSAAGAGTTYVAPTPVVSAGFVSGGGGGFAPSAGGSLVGLTPVAGSRLTSAGRRSASGSQARAAEDGELVSTETVDGIVVLPANATFTSGFGTRWGSPHKGIDLAAPIGTPIYAVMDGTVISSGPASGFGNWIRISHPDGSMSVYGHMQADMLHVNVGDEVRAGDNIAGIGSEGQSTGPHLHFEIYPDGATAVDPVPWFAERGISVG